MGLNRITLLLRDFFFSCGHPFKGDFSVRERNLIRKLRSLYFPLFKHEALRTASVQLREQLAFRNNREGRFRWSTRLGVGVSDQRFGFLAQELER